MLVEMLTPSAVCSRGVSWFGHSIGLNLQNLCRDGWWWQSCHHPCFPRVKMTWAQNKSKPTIQFRKHWILVWGWKQTYISHLLFSVAPGTEENHGQGGWDAPRREKDILGRVCLFYTPEGTEGKHGVRCGKLFHCFTLEGRRGEEKSSEWLFALVSEVSRGI